MKKRVKHFLTSEKKQAMVDQMKKEIEPRPEVLFAILHGSFLLENEPFGDIDLALFLDPTSFLREGDTLEYELQLELALEKVVRLPVDVRVLNRSPIPFTYNVLKNGQLLFCKDEEAYATFFSYVLLSYFDFAPYRKRYLKEVLGFEV